MSEEFSKKMMDQVYDALGLYIPADPKDFKPELFSREGKDIIDVAAIVGNLGSEEDRSDFFKKIEDHRLTRDGLWYYGIKLSYNPKTKMINARDAHVCEVSVIDDRNKPIAYVSFIPQIRVNCSNVRTAERIIYNPTYVISAMKLEDRLYDMSFVDLEERMAYDSINAKQVRFSPDSIENFYSFTDHSGSTKCFVRKTKAMSRSFMNSNMWDLCRHTLNLTSSSNGFGLTFVCWENNLIEADYNGVYLDEDITDDEVKFACSADEDSWFSQEVHRVFNAMHDDSENDQSVLQFTDEIGKVQTIVDSNSSEIFSYLLSRLELPNLPNDEETKKQLHNKEKAFGFDCGCVSFHFMDHDRSEIAKNAAVHGASNVERDGSFYLNLPYETQSTTTQGIMAEKVISIAETEGIQLGCRTCLD